jgi:hypothetical protein
MRRLALAFIFCLGLTGCVPFGSECGVQTGSIRFADADAAIKHMPGVTVIRTSPPQLIGPTNFYLSVSRDGVRGFINYNELPKLNPHGLLYIEASPHSRESAIFVEDLYQALRARVPNLPPHVHVGPSYPAGP